MARDLVDRDRHNKALGLFSAHEAFVHGQPGGKRLVLKDVDFSKLKFAALNLREAVLSGANFSESQFIDTNFSMADLFCASAADADLRDANTANSNIETAVLIGARLQH